MRDEGGSDLATTTTTTQYVYDMETENGHFSAGIGRLVVHNTDSVMIRWTGIPATRQGVDLALLMGSAVSAYITEKFPAEIVLETEKVYWPYVIFRKKRYIGRRWLLNCDVPSLDTKGVDSKRRGVWNGLKVAYKACLKAMIEDIDFEKAKRSVLDLVERLVNNTVPFDDYRMSKSLKRDYSNASTPPEHVVVRNKIRERNPGSEPLAGSRVSYVITYDPSISSVALRAEDPEYVRCHSDTVKIDRIYYLNSLVNPFCALMEPLFENPHVLFENARHAIARQLSGQSSISRWCVRSVPIAPAALPPSLASHAIDSRCSPMPTTSADNHDPTMDESAAHVGRGRCSSDGGQTMTTIASRSDLAGPANNNNNNEHTAVLNAVKRRRTDEGYVPAGVAKERARLARKAKRDAPSCRIGPIHAFFQPVAAADTPRARADARPRARADARPSDLARNVNSPVANAKQK